MAQNVNETIRKLDSIIKKSSKILDIGAGQKEEHANIFRSKGHIVDTVDFFPRSTYQGIFTELNIEKKYDVIWTSHCLEHQPNIGNFLTKCYDVCEDNGYICITVPPANAYKDWIVGGHVTLWNAGLLVYNLVLAGFDCSDANIKSYDRNISVISRKRNRPEVRLVYDRGDLRTLNQWMPRGLQYDRWGHFEGQIQEHNW